MRDLLPKSGCYVLERFHRFQRRLILLVTSVSIDNRCYLMKVIATKKSMVVLPTDDDDEETTDDDADDDEDPSRKRIQINDNVLIDITGRQADDKSITDGPIFQQVSGWLPGVTASADPTPLLTPALYKVLTKLRAGDTALVWCESKHALKDAKRKLATGTETMAPNSNVLYKLTVSQIVMDTSRLNPYFTIQKATTRKAVANDWYGKQWSHETSRRAALAVYKHVADQMDDMLDNGVYFRNVEADHPQRKQVKQLLVDCKNNIAAVYVRAGDVARARKAIKSALYVDSNNISALMRSARLEVTSGSKDEAGAALTAAEKAVTYQQPNEEKQLQTLRKQWRKKYSA